jgi:hypothetical protein
MVLYHNVARDQARVEPPPPAQIRPPPPRPPTGLPNGCNFCFANVALHVLYAILPMRQAVLNREVAPDLAPTFETTESGRVKGVANRCLRPGVR